MNLILLAGAIVVSILIFTWLIKVVRATIGTAIVIALVVLGLQLAFGIGPAQLLQQMRGLWEHLWNMVVQR